MPERTSFRPEWAPPGTRDIASSTNAGGGVARGLLYTVTGQLARILVQVLSLVVLSRLIAPQAFGTVAVLAAMVALCELLRDFGLSLAALHVASLTEKQASNVFWFNLTTGTCLASLLVVGAWIWDDRPPGGVVAVAAIMAATLVVTSAQAIYQVLLSRGTRFATLAGTDVLGQAIGLAAAAFLASRGAEGTALAAQFLIAALITLGGRLWVVRWLPRAPQRRVGMRSMYSYGYHLGLSQLLGYASANADTYSVSIRFGAYAVGLYARAFQLVSVSVNQVLAPVTNALLPALSRAHARGQLWPLLRTLQYAVAAPLSAVLVMGAVLSDDIIGLALGENWRESAPIFAALCLGGVMQALNFVSYWAFLATGSTKELFRYSLVTRPITVALVVAGSFIGLVAVAWGYAISLALIWWICLTWLRKRVAAGAWMLAGGGVLILAAAACSYLAGALVNGQLDGTAGGFISGLVVMTVFVGVLAVDNQFRIDFKAQVEKLNTVKAASR